jgi:2-amino-4-hydroxy-6-hydroxymethyldihydropteridine diphosphokinase
VRAAIAIGSNLGDRRAHVEAAVAALNALPGTRVLAVSGWREYPAAKVGEVDPGGPFLNGAAVIETSLSPAALLAALQGIERARGRDRARPRGSPRELDLDLLLFSDEQVTLPGLTVPHAAMLERAFVLEPLAEVAADTLVPGTGRTVADALRALRSRGGAGPSAARGVVLLVSLAASLGLADGLGVRGAWAFPAAALAGPAPAAPRAPADQPVEIPVAEAWGLIKRAYAGGAIAERVQMTVRTDRGSRRDELELRTWRLPAQVEGEGDGAEKAPADLGLSLSLGSLRVWAAGGVFIVTDARRGDTFWRQDYAGPLTLEVLEQRLPSIALPTLRLLLDPAVDAELPAGGLTQPAGWRSARGDPAGQPPTVTLIGRPLRVPGADERALAEADARTGRLRRMILPVADATGGAAAAVEWVFAPLATPAEPAAFPDLQGRALVESPADLRGRAASP